MKKPLLQRANTRCINRFTLLIAFLASSIILTLQMVVAFQTSYLIGGLDIVTEDGKMETLSTLESLRQKPYWEDVQISIETAINSFDTYLSENSGIAIDKVNLVISGIINDKDEIVPFVTADVSSGELNGISVFFSYEGGGVLILPDGEVFISDNESLFSVAPDGQYIAPYLDGLIAYNGALSCPVPVALGTANREIGQVDWDNVEGIEIAASIEAQQLSSEALGDFTTGVCLILNGKRWEFLSDIPGVTFDADTTDVAFLSNQLEILVDADPEKYKYISPSTHVIRVEIVHDNDFLGEVMLMIETNYGFSTPRFEEEGVLLERIPYSDDFLTFLANPLYFVPVDPTRSITFNTLILQQLYCGGRLGRGFDFEEDPGCFVGMYREFGITPLPSAEGLSEQAFNEIYETLVDELVETFRAIGITSDPNMYPVS
jgi:hypothetical protein